MTAKNGIEEISERQFNDFISKDTALVDFYADWCMPCLMMAPIVEEMSEKFEGKIEFAKVNIEDSQNLAHKFGVMSIPTLIIFKHGEEVERITGSVSAEQLEEKLGAFL